MPAQATITPLSVHRRGGGTTSSSPASHATAWSWLYNCFTGDVVLQI